MPCQDVLFLAQANPLYDTKVKRSKYLLPPNLIILCAYPTKIRHIFRIISRNNQKHIDCRRFSRYHNAKYKYRNTNLNYRNNLSFLKHDLQFVKHIGGYYCEKDEGSAHI